MCNSQIVQLNDIISQGVVLDIFDAEQAIALYEVIGKHKNKLAQNNLENLFGTLQYFFARAAVLAINKIYEEKFSKRYPTRSIPAALKFLEDNHDKFKIFNREELEEKISNLGIDRKSLITLTEAELTTMVVKKIKQNLPTSNKIEAIKMVRDKRIAHHEAIDDKKIVPIMWEQIDELIKLAQSIVGIIGNHYINQLYENNDGEYSLSYEALIVTRSLERLLNKAGILE